METITGILISSAVTLLVCIINNHYQSNATINYMAWLGDITYKSTAVVLGYNYNE